MNVGAHGVTLSMRWRLRASCSFAGSKELECFEKQHLAVYCEMERRRCVHTRHDALVPTWHERETLHPMLQSPSFFAHVEPVSPNIRPATRSQTHVVVCCHPTSSPAKLSTRARELSHHSFKSKCKLHSNFDIHVSAWANLSFPPPTWVTGSLASRLQHLANPVDGLATLPAQQL